MQKNFKLFLTLLLIIVTSINTFAQDEVKYKDVVLDGKPAKLNIATGEITLVNIEVKKKTKPSEIIVQPKPSSVYIVNSEDFHVVQEDESLLAISKKYNVSLTQLKRANNLETTLVNNGETLRVKNFDAVTETISEPSSNNEGYSESNTSNFHIVEGGETLFSLARKYHLTLNELKTLNNLKSNLIYPEQKLRINSFTAREEVNSASVYIVKRGDNLYRIALNNGTTVEAIKSLNGLTSNVIKVGQKLQLN